MKNWKRYTVTSALPYANGPLHIGHLAGVYIPADIYVRYLRQREKDVIFIGGSDEHGVPITIKARNEGISPQEVVNRYHSIIKDSFEKLGISFDIYSRTTNKTHYDTASEFFKKLHQDGKFLEKTTEQYFDDEAKQFLADRYITGTCPHCSNEKAYGDQCENCGTSLNATDLINPKSTISGSKPILKETSHWFLPLDKYEGFLRNWILEEHKEWKTNVSGQCKSWLDMGLQPRAVSRDLDWGVPVPVEGADGKVLYVWFDAPIGYISATKELTKDWEKYWKDEDSCLIHFIGKDNIVFHCIVFPTMLKAEGNYVLPENVPANEFLNLEGDKISTSRNWAVWLHEYLVDFPEKQDVLRYTLCANMPETKDNDFTWKDFQLRNNSELVAILGNFVNRAMVLTSKYFDGKVPSKGIVTNVEDEIDKEIITLKGEIENAIENFKFREALKALMDVARLGNKYLADSEPWKIYKTDPEKVSTILYYSLQIAGALTSLCEPFLPFTSQKLCKMLNVSTQKWDEVGKVHPLIEGHVLGEAFLLFDKIEDEDVQKQVDKLLATKKLNQENALSVAEGKPEISYDDFTKMDIRVGTVLEAEKVPKTQKLLKLKVDTGLDVRTLISGIAEFYSPESMIGKQVCILANLQPRNIKGIESKGMILMAEGPDGTLKLVSPAEISPNGSTVK